MPIKEIITFAFGVIGTLLVLHGPFHLQDEMKRVEVQIVRETARTDNWGNPDIFAGPRAHPSRKQAFADSRRSKAESRK